MAKCFCGCGRKVRLTYRGINKQGNRTRLMIDRLKEARHRVEEVGPLVEDGEVGPLLESVDAKIREGERYEAFWCAAMHDEHAPSPGEALAVKKEWRKWGEASRLMAQVIELPPDQQREVIRKAIL